MTYYAHAFPLQLAREAILLGKYTDAINLIAPLSKSITLSKDTPPDDKTLDTLFFHAYLHAWDDDLSRADAIVQMKQVAEYKHPEANYVLAVCPDLILGDGFALPSTEEQLAYLWQAYLHDAVAAGADLADCYLRGIGVSRSRSLARLILHSKVKRRVGNYPKTCFLLGKLDLDTGGRYYDDYFVYGISNKHPYGDKYVLLTYEEYYLDMLVKVGADTDSISRARDKRDKHKANLLSEWETYLYHFCQQTLRYDLLGVDFDTFCDFVFDHYPLSPNDFDSFRWDRTATVLFDSGELTRFYTALFSDPAFVKKRYSTDQIKQAMEMRGIRGWQEWTVGCAMTSQGTTVAETEALLRSVYGLFEGLLNGYHEDIGFMWWDIGYGACKQSRKWNPELKRAITDDELQRLRDAERDTILRLLNSKNYAYQEAALHAIQHKCIKNGGDVIDDYLARNPNISGRLRDFAEFARKWATA
ncbi:MAG: hypothetical protein AAFV98_17680 [Chloroflexota bacterium]